MKSKIVILILLVIGMVFVSGCVEKEIPETIETLVIWSFTDLDNKVNVPVVLGETVDLKLGIINGIAPGTIDLSEKSAYIKLKLLGAEYISGDFKVFNGETIYQGQVSKDVRYLNIKVRGTGEGKYPLTAELIIPSTYEAKTLNLCIGETLEKAVEFCAQVEETCTTLECIQERTRTDSIQEKSILGTPVPGKISVVFKETTTFEDAKIYLDTLEPNVTVESTSNYYGYNYLLKILEGNIEDHIAGITYNDLVDGAYSGDIKHSTIHVSFKNNVTKEEADNYINSLQGLEPIQADKTKIIAKLNVPVGSEELYISILKKEDLVEEAHTVLTGGKGGGCPKSEDPNIIIQC